MGQFLPVNVRQPAGCIPQKVENTVLIKWPGHVTRKSAISNFVAERTSITEFALDLNTHFNRRTIFSRDFYEETLLHPYALVTNGF